MAVSEAPAKPDISEDVNGILAKGGLSGSVHKWVHVLVHAQSLDHKEGKMGKRGCHVDRIKADIFRECRRDKAFRREWEKASEHMWQSYEEMKNSEPLTDGEPHIDLVAMKKGRELEKLVENMGDITRGMKLG